jgi:hypothetical protein
MLVVGIACFTHCTGAPAGAFAPFNRFVKVDAIDKPRLKDWFYGDGPTEEKINIIIQ